MKVLTCILLCFIGCVSSLSASETLSYKKIKNEKGCTLPSAREEKKLFAQISLESRRLYNSMDCEGKKLAIVLSQQKNACSLLDSQYPELEACKQLSASNFQDKNVAVQLAAKYMAKKKLERYKKDEQATRIEKNIDEDS